MQCANVAHCIYIRIFIYIPLGDIYKEPYWIKNSFQIYIIYICKEKFILYWFIPYIAFAVYGLLFLPIQVRFKRTLFSHRFTESFLCLFHSYFASIEFLYGKAY